MIRHLRLRLLMPGAIACLALLCLAGCGGVPSWVGWSKESFNYELDQESPSEHVELREGRLRITRAEVPVCEAPQDWLVQDAFVADVNQDQTPELVMLCWRRGSYGEKRPFWETERDDEWCQHVFIVQLRDDSLRPLWMSSDVHMEIERMEREGTDVRLIERDGTQTLWSWESWGLTLIEEEGVTQP